MIILNLIPPEQKHDLESSWLYRHWFSASVLLAIFAILSTATFSTTWYVLARHAKEVNHTLTTIQQQQAKNSSTDITATTTQLNRTIVALNTTLATPRPWSINTTTIISLLPSGVTLSLLSIQNNGAFHLVGIADSRQTFLTLDQALKGSTKLAQITTTSTASKRTAVPFDYSGQILPPTS